MLLEGGYRRRRLAWANLLGLSALVLLGPFSTPLSSGVEIPIIAYILNARPEVLSVSLLDDRSAAASTIDPGVLFSIDVRCRDNNTAADIVKVTAVAYSSKSSQSAQDSAGDHYTLRWSNSSGFSGFRIDSSGCRAPSDWTTAEGTWRFRARLGREARAGVWTLVVTVEDEAQSASRTLSFTVNGFASFSLSSQSLEVSGDPGTVASSSLQVSYACNVPISIGVRGTTFVGKQVSSFKLEPGDVMVDDDPSAGSPETGRPILVLSSSRQVLIDRLEGSGQIALYIFVKIPDPFLDQDYQGNLIFDAR